MLQRGQMPFVPAKEAGSLGGRDWLFGCCCRNCLPARPDSLGLHRRFGKSRHGLEAATSFPLVAVVLIREQHATVADLLLESQSSLVLVDHIWIAMLAVALSRPRSDLVSYFGRGI
jgi:hypothetical protein